MKSGLMALLLLWLGTGHANNDNAPLVAVASSLRHVWPHLMIEYQNPVKPCVTFGSSGNFARQITQGAPFELPLSTDESFPTWWIENKTTAQSPMIYTQGKLAWFAPAGSSLAKSLLQANSSEETSLVLPNDVKKIAIANPTFAPGGRAAKALLNSINGIQFSSGDDLVLSLIVEATGESIIFRISRHVAARNDVTTGSQLAVSILAEGIHLMPPEDTQRSNTGI